MKLYYKFSYLTVCWNFFEYFLIKEHDPDFEHLDKTSLLFYSWVPKDSNKDLIYFLFKEVYIVTLDIFQNTVQYIHVCQPILLLQEQLGLLMNFLSNYLLSFYSTLLKFLIAINKEPNFTTINKVTMYFLRIRRFTDSQGHECSVYTLTFFLQET